MSTVSLTDFKTFASITESNRDASIQETIDAAEASIARRCGPLAATMFTRRVRGGKSVLFIPISPVVSVSGVTPVDGTALDVSKLTVDPSGAVEMAQGGCFTALWYDVVFTSGRQDVSADLIQAVKEHARHLWETQQGATRSSRSSQSNAASASYVFGSRMNELLAPHMQGGFA